MPIRSLILGSATSLCAGLGWTHQMNLISRGSTALSRLTAWVIEARGVERHASGVAATALGAGTSLAIGANLGIGAVRPAVGEGQRLLKGGEGELAVGIVSTRQRFGLDQVEPPLVIEHCGHRVASVTARHDKLPAIDPVDSMREVEF